MFIYVYIILLNVDLVEKSKGGMSAIGNKWTSFHGSNMHGLTCESPFIIVSRFSPPSIFFLINNYFI